MNAESRTESTTGGGPEGPTKRKGGTVIASAVAAVAAIAAVGATVFLTTRGDKDSRTVAQREIDLGKAIFFDTSLSSPAGQSCASCHDPEHHFTDPDSNVPTSAGVNTKLFGNRNTPTAAYAALSPKFHYDPDEGLYVGGQFLDGRAATLTAQAQKPFLNPVEMGNKNAQELLEKVQLAGYADEIRYLYGQTIFDTDDEAMEHLGKALAAFEKTPQFSPFSSKYDAYLAGKATLTAQEKLGLDVFKEEKKGNCAACHVMEPDTKATFTDFTYDNLGVPANPDNRFYGLAPVFNKDGSSFVDLGLGGSLKKPAENGKFKVPTLRNIAETAPYAHNGYFTSLESIVNFYNTRDTKPACADKLTDKQAMANGCWPEPEVGQNVNHDELGNLGLTSKEETALVAFMKTLTDGWKAGADTPN